MSDRLTVAELMEMLSSHDPDAEVWISGDLDRESQPLDMVYSSDSDGERLYLVGD